LNPSAEAMMARADEVLADFDSATQAVIDGRPDGRELVVEARMGWRDVQSMIRDGYEWAMRTLADG
jgi:hypothetical protein